MLSKKLRYKRVQFQCEKSENFFNISYEHKSGSAFFVWECNFGGSVAEWLGRSDLQHDLF